MMGKRFIVRLLVALSLVAGAVFAEIPDLLAHRSSRPRAARAVVTADHDLTTSHASLAVVPVVPPVQTDLIFFSIAAAPMADSPAAGASGPQPSRAPPHFA